MRLSYKKKFGINRLKRYEWGNGKMLSTPIFLSAATHHVVVLMEHTTKRESTLYSILSLQYYIQELILIGHLVQAWHAPPS